jgi:predicted alpha/beta superfamily hydrolase
MKINLLGLILINLSSYVSYSQVTQEDNIVGTNHYIDSKILEEKRQIQIYLPDGYNEAETTYSVLYLLDGQQFFPYGVSLIKNFKHFNLTPEFIVVGITNSFPQRYGHFSDGKDKFIKFMEEELLPYVDENFRTTKEKLLFGWQYAGSLGFHILIDNSSLFDGYFLASPFPIINKIDDLDKISTLNKTLYFFVSPDEYEVNKGTDKLDSLLTNKNISGLKWSYIQLEKEGHQSTSFPALYHGLRKYYKYYPQLQVDNLQEFVDSGGLEYAYAFTKERALRHGFSPDLSTWSKYTIIRSAIRADDYDHFETFTNKFISSEFIEELDSRALDLAVFYEKHIKHDKAIEIYSILLEKHPDSGRLLNKMGNAHKALGKNEEAERYFQRAQEIAKDIN